MLLPLRWLFYGSATPQGPQGGTSGVLRVGKRTSFKGSQSYKTVLAVGSGERYSDKLKAQKELVEKLKQGKRINDEEALLMILANL